MDLQLQKKDGVIQDLITKFMEDWARAWDTADPALFASLFTQDAVLYDTPFSEAKIGTAAIKQYWEITRLQKDITVGYEILSATSTSGISRWWAEWTILPQEDWPPVTAVADSFATLLEPNAQNRFAQDGIAVVRFNEKALATEFREWWHTHRI